MAHAADYCGKKLTLVKEFLGTEIFLCTDDGKFVLKGTGQNRCAPRFTARKSMREIEKVITERMAAVKVFVYGGYTNLSSYMITSVESHGNFYGRSFVRYRKQTGELLHDYAERDMYVWDNAIIAEARELEAEVKAFEAEKDKFYTDARVRMEVIKAKLTKFTPEEFKKAQDLGGDLPDAPIDALIGAEPEEY